MFPNQPLDLTVSAAVAQDPLVHTIARSCCSLLPGVGITWASLPFIAPLCFLVGVEAQSFLSHNLIPTQGWMFSQFFLNKKYLWFLGYVVTGDSDVLVSLGDLLIQDKPQWHMSSRYTQQIPFLGCVRSYHLILCLGMEWLLKSLCEFDQPWDALCSAWDEQQRRKNTLKSPCSCYFVLQLLGHLLLNFCPAEPVFLFLKRPEIRESDYLPDSSACVTSWTAAGVIV